MKREDLDFEPFYYVEPMRIIDDPDESIKEFFKYDKEKTEVENYLKDCTLNDFIWVVITVFKNEFADGGLLGSLISNTSIRQSVSNGDIYVKESSNRKDLKTFKFKYNQDDHFEYLEFEIVSPFSQINSAIEDALSGKNYSRSGDKYILTADSGIEYIEATPTFFKLKANMKKSKRFH